MPEDEIFKENIKKSFFNVKEDISILKEDNKAYKMDNKEIKDNLANLSEKMDKIALLLENKDKKTFFNFSSGNEGVVNSQQSTINNSQQSSTMINNPQQSTIENLKKDIDKINSSLTFKFKSITDRELSVFLAIYDLELEKSEVSYTEIANKLKLTESTIRTNVNSLIKKGLPIQKERFFNKKVTLTISQDFRNLNLLNKILEIRKPNIIQRTLLDI